MKKLITKTKYLLIPCLLSPLSVFAYNFKTESGLDKTADRAGYSGSLLELNPENMIMQMIGMVLTFVGILFLVLMIYGGLKWMTASGSESEVEKAKKIVIQGVTGVLIVFAAYAITYFIVSFFSSKTLS